MGRVPCCEKVGLKRGRWTAEEDDALAKYIQANGEGSWRSLPKNAGLLRCGKSCRLRWINYLRPDLKRGNISSDEEEIIFKLHASMGNRWSVIAAHLPGRTDNEIKNYWNAHLSGKIVTVRRPTPPPINPSEVAAKPPADITPTPNKRRGGRTSQASMKINKVYKASLAKRAATLKPPPENNISQPNNTTPPLVLPLTPVVEKEGLLSSAMSWQEEVMAGITLDTSGMEDNEGETEMLCINDLMDNGWMKQNDGVLIGGGESDNRNNEGAYCSKVIENTEMATCEGQSCTSTNSVVLDHVNEIGNCDWGIGEGNDLLLGENYGYFDDEEEKGFMWPWEIKDGEDMKGVGRDVEKEINVMAAWLLS